MVGTPSMAAMPLVIKRVGKSTTDRIHGVIRSRMNSARLCPWSRNIYGSFVPSRGFCKRLKRHRFAPQPASTSIVIAGQDMLHVNYNTCD